jgi:hypothetical protein
MVRHDERGLFNALAKDGLPVLTFTAVGLILSGLIGLFLAVSGEFLPHDLRFLGMPLDHL